jgi:hypothetical protein
MSGVETAGLVLGTIPLILAGLEFYAKGIAVTKRYWRYREEIRGLIVQLSTEQQLYVNTITTLLIGIVEQDDMPILLDDPCGSRWKDEEFERKLKQRLDTSYETYIQTIDQFHQTVNMFREQLRLHPNGKVFTINCLHR